jgi:hypothetical protein
MEYQKKLAMALALRKAFVAGATEGKFGMDAFEAFMKACEKYPLPKKSTGELSEIAEANRVPQFTPRTGEYSEVTSEVEAF